MLNLYCEITCGSNDTSGVRELFTKAKLISVGKKSLGRRRI